MVVPESWDCDVVVVGLQAHHCKRRIHRGRSLLGRAQDQKAQRSAYFAILIQAVDNGSLALFNLHNKSKNNLVVPSRNGGYWFPLCSHQSSQALPHGCQEKQKQSQTFNVTSWKRWFSFVKMRTPPSLHDQNYTYCHFEGEKENQLMNKRPLCFNHA